MFRTRDGSRWIWGHWQNLTQVEANERRPRGAREVRRFPWNGRAWLYVGRLTFGFEWNLWSHFCHTELRMDDGEGEIVLGVALPPVSLWFSVEGLPTRWMPKDGREISVSVHDWAFWFNLWGKPWDWTAKDRWRHPIFHIDDFFLGRQVYSEQTVAEDRVTIPMPEGPYPGTVRIFESAWKRPRWFAHRMIRATVTPDTPIPIPGKGTASWNCGEDATHSLTTPADTVRKAVLATIESVLRTREKHGSRRGGGTEWRPAEKKVAPPEPKESAAGG